MKSKSNETATTNGNPGVKLLGTSTNGWTSMHAFGLPGGRGVVFTYNEGRLTQTQPTLSAAFAAEILDAFRALNTANPGVQPVNSKPVKPTTPGSTKPQPKPVQQTPKASPSAPVNPGVQDRWTVTDTLAEGKVIVQLTVKGDRNGIIVRFADKQAYKTVVKSDEQLRQAWREAKFHWGGDDKPYWYAEKSDTAMAVAAKVATIING